MGTRQKRLVERMLTAAWRQTGSLAAALGLVLIIGFLVAGAAAWAFTELAESVQAGATLPLDNAALHWMAAHQSGLASAMALEATALGAGMVALMIAAIAGTFLALMGSRRASLLLVSGTAGGMALRDLLKLFYHRPRPRIFPWATNVVSSSFPSGHAMNAVIVYGTIAYLITRMTNRAAVRGAAQLVAVVVVLAICTSRVYLGVHYPSDVLGGVIIGGAWALFCASAVESAGRIRGMAQGREIRPPTSGPRTDRQLPE